MADGYQPIDRRCAVICAKPGSWATLDTAEIAKSPTWKSRLPIDLTRILASNALPCTSGSSCKLPPPPGDHGHHPDESESTPVDALFGDSDTVAATRF